MDAEQRIEKLAEALCKLSGDEIRQWIKGFEPREWPPMLADYHKYWLDKAEEHLAFLSTLGCCWRAEDQTLPTEPHFYDDWGGVSGKLGYQRGQIDLLKAGFVKVEGK